MERVNSTIKRGTTRSILGEVHRVMKEGQTDFLHISRVTNTWVSKMMKFVELYNDSVKYLTGSFFYFFSVSYRFIHMLFNVLH